MFFIWSSSILNGTIVIPGEVFVVFNRKITPWGHLLCLLHAQLLSNFRRYFPLFSLGTPQINLVHPISEICTDEPTVIKILFTLKVLYNMIYFFYNYLKYNIFIQNMILISKFIIIWKYNIGWYIKVYF